MCDPWRGNVTAFVDLLVIALRLYNTHKIRVIETVHCMWLSQHSLSKLECYQIKYGCHTGIIVCFIVGLLGVASPIGSPSSSKRDLVLRFPQSVVIILLGRITQNVPQQLPTMDLSFSNFARVEASQNIGQIHDPRFTDTDHARRPVDFGWQGQHQIVYDHGNATRTQYFSESITTDSVSTGTKAKRRVPEQIRVHGFGLIVVRLVRLGQCTKEPRSHTAHPPGHHLGTCPSTRRPTIGVDNRVVVDL